MSLCLFCLVLPVGFYSFTDFYHCFCYLFHCFGVLFLIFESVGYLVCYCFALPDIMFLRFYSILGPCRICMSHVLVLVLLVFLYLFHSAPGFNYCTTLILAESTHIFRHLSTCYIFLHFYPMLYLGLALCFHLDFDLFFHVLFFLTFLNSL